MRALLPVLLALTLSPVMALADSPQPLTITRVTPAGEDVEATRQIVIAFNRAVVPLGRMERTAEEIPVKITPELPCQWRWLNPSTLACQLGDDDALKPATRYEIEIGTQITAEDGGQIAKPYSHRFLTKRPTVSYSWFAGWNDVSTPELQVNFSAPVTETSVQKALYFRVGGSALVPVTVAANPNDSSAAIKTKDGDARTQWLISSADPLPAASSVVLMLGKGLVTPLGSEVSTDERELNGFSTFPEFTLQGLRCESVADQTIQLLPNNTAPQSKCDPQRTIALSFTSPMAREVVARSAELRSETTGKVLPLSAWGTLGDSTSYRVGMHREGDTYTVYLPQLKAAREYSITLYPKPQGFFARTKAFFARLFGAGRPPGIQDRFERGLHEAVTIRFATDHRRANYELPNNTAVIEQETDSEIPLYVNNLEKMDAHYTALTTDGRKDKQSHTVTPPFVQDIQFAVPLGLRDMLGNKSGAVYGTLSATPYVKKYESDSRLFAQVTPYHVNAKIGHFESLVWVTDFATGKPVEGAKVALQQFNIAKLTREKEFASAVTDKDGVAILPGYASVDPREKLLDQWKDDASRLAVMVTKGEAMALLPMAYDFEIDIWRASNETIYPSTRNRHQHMQAWGTTAQGVYRAGQEIDYKLYVRDETGRALALPKGGKFDLTLIDPMGNEVHKVEELKLNQFGSYAGSYPLSKQAVMGWYRFELTARHADMAYTDEKTKERTEPTVTLEPMRVLVSDFTPAPFKVSSELNGSPFLANQKATLSTRATLYSGGAYGDAKTRISAQLIPQYFRAKSFPGFSFEHEREMDALPLTETDVTLDSKGESETDIVLPGAEGPSYASLVVESAVMDERGKSVASETRAPYFGRDRLVGIKSSDWIFNAGKEASVLLAVVDSEGKPVSGVPVSVQFTKEEVKTARVKSAGNSYSSETTTTWEKQDSCKEKSANEAVKCSFTPKRSGYYRAIAEIKDSKGRTHESSAYLWVSGSDYVQWNDDAESVLPLVAEQDSYNIGDTARVLVRNPYPGATALITVERYGVIDRFTQVLEGSTPTITFPVKPDYVPGFYLSVTVVSPRVEKPLKVGEVDLGKPTQRLGYLSFEVKDRHKEITVTPKVAREEYRPRDEVEVTVTAAPKAPGAEQEPIEVAAIVLDEAVFDLIASGRSYFDPYAGLYSLSGLDLKNYALMARLVGRQKFETKGANPGGDGGVDLSMRNLFKFVAYWNPSLPVDKNGKAHFSFTAPDNLTGWRVLTLAATPNDRFGLGETSFRVNRPTEIRPAMPNQVREGDTFAASFCVMNRTDKERSIEVMIEAKGALAKNGEKGVVHTEKVTLAPYKRAIVSLPLAAASTVANDASIRFTATAQDASDGDATEHSIPVLKALTLVTSADTSTTTESELTRSIALPTAMRGDAGSLSVTLSSSVLGNLEGAFGYLRDYPYGCWEQRLSKAIAAVQYRELNAYLPASMQWKEADKYAPQVLADASSFQAPNGGMAYFIARDDYTDPYLSAYTAYGFNLLRAAGQSIPADVEAKLHAYLVQLLKKDTTPEWYDDGMRADVRALALFALAPSGKVDAADLARFAPQLTRMSLLGQSQFLQAALLLAPDSPHVAQAYEQISSKGIESSGTLRFNETLDSGYERMLTTPLRDNCAVLSSFISLRRAHSDVVAEDIPLKIARAITDSRGTRDHWANTQENLYCSQAMIDYATLYEATPPSFTANVRYHDSLIGEAKFDSFRSPARSFVREFGASDIGKKTNVAISKSGEGRVYATTRVTYAPTDSSAERQNAGMELIREWSVKRDGTWQLLAAKEALKSGDLVRVDLYLSLPAAQAFVAVDDPVAGGLEPVNSDLATSSKRDSEAANFAAADGAFRHKRKSWIEYGSGQGFYHQELGHNAVRFYADYLEPGNYHLSYSAQVVADGTFLAPPAKAEAMYEPDIFGSSSSLTLQSGERK